jgi:hypothetical protein
LLANVNKLPADQKTDDKIHEAITANDFQLKDAQTMDAIKAYIMENKD